jgi:hypothetical protein
MLLDQWPAAPSEVILDDLELTNHAVGAVGPDGRAREPTPVPFLGVSACT